MQLTARKYQINLRKRRIENKVCVNCGGILENSNHVHCNECLNKYKNYQKKQRNKFALEKRCRSCGGDLGKDSEFVTCYDCRLNQRIRRGSKTAMKELKEQLANGEYHRRQLKKRQAVG